MSDAWGPWIEHDGRGCPVKGQLVQIAVLMPWGKYKVYGPVIAGSDCSANGIDPDQSDVSAWVWPNGKPEPERITHYRVRRPRALEQLRQIAENPTAPLPQRRPSREFA